MAASSRAPRSPSDPTTLGPYTPSALILVIVLACLGIAGDSFRQEYNLEQWMWWGIIALLMALTLLGGRQDDGARGYVRATPWRTLIASSDYEGALRALIKEVRAAPDERVDLYIEIADVYRKPEVGLYEDALAWLNAAYDRVCDTPLAATVLLHRAETLHYGLGKSREAAVDLMVIEREFPEEPAALQATALRGKISADWRSAKQEHRAV